MPLLFYIFPIFFLLTFAFVFTTIIMSFVRTAKQEQKNNNSPRITVFATVVTKRDQVTVHRHDHHRHTNTRYFVTFQVESGDRMELQVDGPDFGMLVEGDKGQLSFQGTRFLGFVRA